MCDCFACVEALEQMRGVDPVSGFASHSEMQRWAVVDAGPGSPDASLAKPVGVEEYALASTRIRLR